MTGRYSDRGAALGGRTIKTGRSRWFVGYQKHTLRLWLNGYSPSVQLVPLASWIAPAQRADVSFLRPSLLYCCHVLEWLPDLMVEDMGYTNVEKQRQIREQWQVAVVTKLRADMKLVPLFENGPRAVCPKGRRWSGWVINSGIGCTGSGSRPRIACANAAGKRVGFGEPFK